jgi:hypothetical protein
LAFAQTFLTLNKMKKIILIFFFLLGCVVFSQTTFDWMNTAPDGNWRQGASGARWFGGSCGGGCFDEPGFGILRFNNNHQLTMTNNVPGTYNIHQIIFGSSNTSNRTIGNAGANIIRFFDSSGADPKIENQSSGSHIISFNILGDGDAGDPLEINPVSGNLTFNNTIGNQGSPIDIYGNNGFTARFNNIISGAGAFRIRQNSKVIFNDLNTYSGNTELDNGELWIETTGDAIASGSAIWLGNGGQLGNTTKIFLSRAAGGTTFSRNINVNPGNTRFLGGLNTSGTSTFSGSILRSASGRPLTIEVVNAGGTVAFTGAINGSDDITKIGPGTMQLATNNSWMTGTWLVENGTLLTDNFPVRMGIRPITLGTASTSGTLRFTGTSAVATSIQFNVNAGGGAIYNASTTNFASNTGFTINGPLTVGAENSGNLSIAGAIAGTSGVNYNSTGSGKVVLAIAMTYTGATRITSGTMETNNPNRIADTSNIIMNGGTYSTGAATGNSDTVGTLQLLENSIIRLGDGGNSHTLTFAASNIVSWTSGKTLTITNWSGTPGTGGTASAGRIIVGSSNAHLTATQLDQITFEGYEPGAVMKTSGEIMPKGYITYYSKGSLAPNTEGNWSRTPDGLGASPANFTSPARFVIQNGHTMTTSAAWSTNSTLQIENGGTLVSTFAVTIPATGTFQIDNGGLYKHDNANAWGSSIFQGTEVFGNSSTVEINKTNTSLPNNSSYGNLTIDLSVDPGAVLSFAGNLTTVNGNFIVKHTRGRQVRLAASTGPTVTVSGNFEVHPNADFAIVTGTENTTLNVDGNINLVGGTFSLATSSGVGFLVSRGPSVTISENVTFAGALPGTTGFYFNRNVEQTLNIAHPFTTGSVRNRFYVSTANSQPINEVYNGVSAQETINGTGIAPGAGWAAWPTSGTALKNLIINNTSSTGVTLRDNRTVNNVLTLTDGELITGVCSATTSNIPLLTMAAGSSVSGGSNASYVKGVIRKVGNTAFTFPVGTNGKYAPIYISAPSGSTDHFTTCYNDANATVGTTKETGVRDLSTCEHWFLNRGAGSSAVNVSLNLNNDRCATQTCGQIVNLDGTVWRNRGSITPVVPNNSYVTSNPTTSFGTFTWASGVLPVNHTNSATGDETKIGFGTQATMSTDFPKNRTGGFIAFDTKSKGFVIPRVSNANRPAGAEGLLIYNTDSNCMQLFSSGAWKCIEPVCE